MLEVGILGFITFVLPVICNVGGVPEKNTSVVPKCSLSIELWAFYWMDALAWFADWMNSGKIVSEKCIPLAFRCSTNPAHWTRCVEKYGYIETPTVLHYASLVLLLSWVFLSIWVIPFVWNEPDDYGKNQ
jgi:hypothetical protein